LDRRYHFKHVSLKQSRFYHCQMSTSHRWRTEFDGSVAIISIKNFPIGLRVMYLYFLDMPRILQSYYCTIKHNNMLPIKFVSDFTIQVFTKLYIPVLQKSVIHWNKTETVHTHVFCKVAVITHENQLLKILIFLKIIAQNFKPKHKPARLPCQVQSHSRHFVVIWTLRKGIKIIGHHLARNLSSG
jgi:hypothetical protein